MGLLNMLGTLGGSVIGAISNKRNNDRNVDLQKKVNAQNQANWQAEFDYTKYLNANQYQIQSQDMRNAGINPIAGMGAGVQSFSSSPQTSTGPQTEAFDFVQLIPSLIQAATSKDVARIQANSAEKVAGINASASKYASDASASASNYASDTSANASKYSADTQAVIASNNLKENARQFNETLQENKYQFNRTTEKDVNAMKADFQKSIPEIRNQLMQYYDGIKFGRPTGGIAQWFNDRMLDTLPVKNGESRNEYVDRAVSEMSRKFYDVLNSSVRRD